MFSVILAMEQLTSLWSALYFNKACVSVCVGVCFCGEEEALCSLGTGSEEHVSGGRSHQCRHLSYLWWSIGFLKKCKKKNVQRICDCFLLNKT